MMSEGTATIPALIRQTLADPRGAARRIIGMDLPASVLWEALALVVVLSALAAQLAALMLGAGGEMMPGGFPASPLLMGLVQGAILVVMVFAIHLIGRSLGGQGRLEDSIAAVAWLQFLLVCLQIVQTGAAVVSPALSGFVGLLGVVAFFWLLTQFVMVLHGFQSAAMVFVMIVLSLLGVTFVVSMILAILGVAVVGEMPGV
jgi:hypothetical protein